MDRFPSGQREQTVNLPSLTSVVRIHPHPHSAGMAELADAHDSGSCALTSLQVQVLFPAPNQYNPNQLFLVGDGFGLFLFFEKEEKPVRIKGRPGRPRKKQSMSDLCSPEYLDAIYQWNSKVTFDELPLKNRGECCKNKQHFPPLTMF